MADNRTYIQLSVFDRLNGTSDLTVLGGRVADLQIVKRAVVRDVENLLNTRRIIIKPPASYKHLNKSLFVYGIEDFVAKNPKNPEVFQALQNSIQQTLSKFEPRLKGVSVEFNERDGNEQNLCFTVMATLYADPIHEPIYFDTWFLVNRGEYQIRNTK
jgi:type VI secretion system protein ImpF